MARAFAPAAGIPSEKVEEALIFKLLLNLQKKIATSQTKHSTQKGEFQAEFCLSEIRSQVLS